MNWNFTPLLYMENGKILVCVVVPLSIHLSHTYAHLATRKIVILLNNNYRYNARKEPKKIYKFQLEMMKIAFEIQKGRTFFFCSIWPIRESLIGISGPPFNATFTFYRFRFVNEHVKYNFSNETYLYMPVMYRKIRNNIYSTPPYTRLMNSPANIRLGF